MTGKYVNQRKRRGKERNSKPCILLGVEGNNKTEKNYFNHLKEKNRKYRIIFATGNDTDVGSIFLNMQKDIKKRKFGSKDRFFCVVDLDNSHHKENKIKELQSLKSSKNIEFIISNPTFEVWFLLHFYLCSSYFNSGSDVIKELKKFVPTYVKNIDDFEIFDKNMEIAIKNAETLEKLNAEKESSTDKNPSTDVHKIVKLMKHNK